MNISTYCITWNEEVRLPWYLDNYSYADAHHIYDSYSDDNTLAIAKANPKCTVKTFGTKGVASNIAYLDVKGNCWKGSKADWVIVGDVDELLYHPNMLELLATTKATLLTPSKAYSMVSEEDFTDYKQVKIGCHDPGYLKTILFRPSEIKSMGYVPGCHQCNPTGNVIHETPEELVMYHYNHVGFERTVARYAAHGARRSKVDRQRKWSVHYEVGRQHLREYFDRALKCAEVRTW